MERGDEVEVLFAGFVVPEEFALENVLEEFGSYGPRGVFLETRTLGSEFEGVVGGAGVAVGERGDAKEDVFGDFDRFVAEAAVLVSEGAAEQVDDLRRGERFEDVHLGAGEKRGDDFKGGIFGGRTNESDMAGFDVRKKGILLGFVEAMDLVDEDDGAVAGARLVFGGGHDVLDFLDASKDRTERDEICVRDASDEARERSFATAGRSPEEHRADVVAFDLQAQRLSWTEKLFLPDELVELARPHAFGEGLGGGGSVAFRGGRWEFGEEAHGLP